MKMVLKKLFSVPMALLTFVFIISFSITVSSTSVHAISSGGGPSQGQTSIKCTITDTINVDLYFLDEKNQQVYTSMLKVDNKYYGSGSTFQIKFDTVVNAEVALDSNHQISDILLNNTKVPMMGNLISFSSRLPRSTLLIKLKPPEVKGSETIDTPGAKKTIKSETGGDKKQNATGNSSASQGGIGKAVTTNDQIALATLITLFVVSLIVILLLIVRGRDKKRR